MHGHWREGSRFNVQSSRRMKTESKVQSQGRVTRTLDFGLWTLDSITRGVPSVAKLNLQSSVREFPGVCRERAAQLERLKIFAIDDLLLHRPHRYEDRRHFISIAELKLKEPASVRGKIVAQGVKYYSQCQ